MTQLLAVDFPESIRASWRDALVVRGWLGVEPMGQDDIREKLYEHLKSHRINSNMFCNQSNMLGYTSDTLVLYHLGTLERVLVVLHEMAKAGLVTMTGRRDAGARYSVSA